MDPTKTDQLRTHFTTLLQWISDTAIQGGEFVKAQAPDIANQLILWGMVSALLLTVGWLLLTIPLIFLQRWCLFRFNKASKQYHERLALATDAYDRIRTPTNDYPAWLIGVFVPLIPQLLFLALAGTSFYNAVFVWVAPKVYLLQELAEFAKRL